MKFIIGGIHRSGTNFLAKCLNDILVDYTVIAEEPRLLNDAIKPEDYYKRLDKVKDQYAAKVAEYIANQPDKWGQVSPQYTTVLRDYQIKAKKAFLVRNPYDAALSKINFFQGWGRELVDKLIYDIDTYYSIIYANRKIKKFKYEDLDEKGISEIVDYFKLKADYTKLNIKTKVNPSRGNLKTLEQAVRDRRALKALREVCDQHARNFKYEVVS